MYPAMTLLDWYVTRMHESCKVRTSPTVTTINQAMGRGVSREGTKQSLQWAECRCGMLFEIQQMLKFRELFNTMQTCEGEWEKSYDNGITPFWKKWIEVKQLPSTCRLVMVWVAERLMWCMLTLLRYVYLLMKHGSLLTVPWLLQNVLLLWHLHH